MKHLENEYKRISGAGLTPQIKNQISTLINTQNNFKMFDGPPSAHAEIIAQNYAIARLPASGALKDINVATYVLRLSTGNLIQGKPFPQCVNCTIISPNEVRTSTGKASQMQINERFPLIYLDNSNFSRPSRPIPYRQQ